MAAMSMVSDDERGRKQTKRLFFALWPDASLQAQIDAVSRNCRHSLRGRYLPRENLHLTLVFLGAADSGKEICVRRVAEGIDSDGFTLMLDRLGCFPRSGILWLGASVIPDALTVLVGGLNQKLHECGHCPEQRAYHAHVSLARNVSRIPVLPQVTPLEWPVRGFHLVESQTPASGAVYQILASWDLR
jgi:2'-5' RNA ligase